MPIVTRKRRLLSHVIDVFLAPFIFIGVNLVMGWWIIAFMGMVLLIVYCINGDVGDWHFSQETIVGSAIGILFISVAAIPLAIRDFFSGDKEQIWIKDENCLEISILFR